MTERIIIFEFPAYRSAEWMKRPLVAPTEILRDADLKPQHMQYFPNNALFQSKAASVREQIRTALFRQALYKVQNVEIMDSSCSSNFRVLAAVTAASPSTELWTVKRCDRDVLYEVQYSREDGDGFSVEVSPVSWADKFRAFRFNFIESRDS
jgi:hypothetical protein